VRQGHDSDADGWRGLISPAREAARRLVEAGVVVTQKGEVVDPATARGPIRIRLVNSP